MPSGLGPRFLIEAGFIIAVATVAGIERFRTLVIIAVVAAAWAVVALVELGLEVKRRSRTRATGAQETSAGLPAAPAREPVQEPEPNVRVAHAESEPEPPPEPVVTPGPRAEPEQEPQPDAPKEPPEPEPSEPEPPQPRVLAAAPPVPEPEREPLPEQEPEPAPTVVSLESRRGGPREWNVWELERLAREQATDDVARNEERAYLLMYLREFANADGILPADFDGVVRETFGDMLDAAFTS